MFVFLGILSFNFDCFVLLFLYIFFNLDLFMNRNTTQSLCVIRFNFMYAHTGNFDKCTNYSIPVSNFFSMTYLICLIKKKFKRIFNFLWTNWSLKFEVVVYEQEDTVQKYIMYMYITIKVNNFTIQTVNYCIILLRENTAWMFV